MGENRRTIRYYCHPKTGHPGSGDSVQTEVQTAENQGYISLKTPTYTALRGGGISADVMWGEKRVKYEKEERQKIMRKLKLKR
jgi:hypothetical protein